MKKKEKEKGSNKGEVVCVYIHGMVLITLKQSARKIGEGNDTPLQCSCLNNPRDGGTWWAAVHGVAKSQT